MDIVRQLPDSVANQIAAGEVVQRPASVVKELTENAVDAGATLVKVIVTGAGRQSIQVIDNGCGMSESDARMSFERHATSKIRNAEDLFEIQTMGFRGEALASIAAVAQVEVRTRREEDRVGVLIEINGSRVERQEPVECQKGTRFVVKNLFYNVPARRKFLKTDETEMKNILTEFQRVAIAHENVAFELYNGNELMMNLPAGNFRQRVTQLYGKNKKSFAQDLIPIHAETTIVNIDGFVGRPESAGKYTPQVFLANNRFIMHPLLRRAVIQAYDRMLQNGAVPLFFVKIAVKPSAVDVNIHPTKTEVKFEDEKEIFSILMVCVREALGKYNVSAPMDFDNDVEIPNYREGANPKMPEVNFDRSYDPFRSCGKKPVERNWQEMFQGLRNEVIEGQDQRLDFHGEELRVNAGLSVNTSLATSSGNTILDNNENVGESIFFRGKWLCVALSSGLVAIDVPAAVYRIEYDRLMQSEMEVLSQRILFDEILELDGDSECIFTELEKDLEEVGFRFEQFGRSMYRVTSVPAVLAEDADRIALIKEIIHDTREGVVELQREMKSQLASRIARCASRIRREHFSREERERLVARLFASSNPNTTPDGKTIVKRIEL